MNNVDYSMTTISEKQSESEANSTIYSKKYDDDYDDNNDYVRRHSNQYNFRGTTTSYSRNTRDDQPRQQDEYVNNPGNTYNSSNAGEQEIIFDTRDAHVANRQIISDDEGEYVDFVEEK